jgi:K+-sensing histidine kinase KdpD
MRRYLEIVGRPLTGILLCLGAALALVLLFSSTPWRVFAPLALAGIIILAAARYGLLVSVLGSIAAALVFAYFLYPPLGSFRVASQAERANIGWMMMASIALSYLLLPGPRNRSH